MVKTETKPNKLKFANGRDVYTVHYWLRRTNTPGKHNIYIKNVFSKRGYRMKQEPGLISMVKSNIKRHLNMKI